MRYTGFLLVGLLLAPTVLAGPEGPLGAPERALAAAEDASACLSQTADAGPGPSCAVLLACLPVFLEIQFDPLWVTPIVRTECVWGAVTTVRGLIGI